MTASGPGSAPAGPGAAALARDVASWIRAGRGPDPRLLRGLVAAEEPRLGTVGRSRMHARLEAELLGLGPLEGAVADPSVTDVLVNGTGEVWVDRGSGLERATGDLAPDEVRLLAVRLAGRAGRRLDEAQPWVDGLLPSGIRLHAVLPPLVEGGAHVSLRVPRRTGVRLDALAAGGMVSASHLEDLRALVRERVAFVVTGGTGTGKTTLLGALLAEAPARERLVVVEDVRELEVAHPHVVRLQARPPNVEGAGRVDLSDLVRQALRMRPDRLVVGEVRGGEVRELLAALNTGHEGGCGTLHANRPEDVPARLEALGALAGMSPAAVRAQSASALSTVVHLVRDGNGRRRVAAVRPLPHPPGSAR